MASSSRGLTFPELGKVLDSARRLLATQGRERARRAIDSIQPDLEYLCEQLERRGEIADIEGGEYEDAYPKLLNSVDELKEQLVGQLDVIEDGIYADQVEEGRLSLGPELRETAGNITRLFEAWRQGPPEEVKEELRSGLFLQPEQVDVLVKTSKNLRKSLAQLRTVLKSFIGQSRMVSRFVQENLSPQPTDLENLLQSYDLVLESVVGVNLRWQQFNLVTKTQFFKVMDVKDLSTFPELEQIPNSLHEAEESLLQLFEKVNNLVQRGLVVGEEERDIPVLIESLIKIGHSQVKPLINVLLKIEDFFIKAAVEKATLRNVKDKLNERLGRFMEEAKKGFRFMGKRIQSCQETLRRR